MAQSSKPRISFDSIRKTNQALDQEIRTFSTDDQDDQEETLKQLLNKLHSRLSDFSEYRGSASTPDKKIMAAWESFLEPIRSLADVKPHGRMMAARMVLYLTRAFLRSNQLPNRFPMESSSAKPIALRCHFLILLDDTLLSYLTDLWSRSGNRERFDWVFTDYQVQDVHMCTNCGPKDLKDHPELLKEWREQKNAERLIAACLTKPQELTPANGVRPSRSWTRPEGDTKFYQRHPEASTYDYSTDEQGDKVLMWQRIGSDGPIREHYRYDLVDPDTSKVTGQQRPALRRSRQFVLDTQKVRVLREKRRLVHQTLAKYQMPAELGNEVWKYVEPVPEEPYLDKLDLSAVYRPFPDTGKGGKCQDCAARSDKAADKQAKKTCPLKSITIWNLPLRIFHTLHEKTPNHWKLCPQVNCTGHHENGDWQTGVVQLQDHLNEILSDRCGPGTTLEDVGFGPLDPIVLPTEAEDNERKRRLWHRHHHDDLKKHDAIEEAEWIGIDGLVGVMLHDRTLLGRHPHGHTETEAHWMFGRTKREEFNSRVALRKS